MADRFYCPEPPKAGRVTLRDDEARHLARVRRLGPGDMVEIFDGRGMGYRAEVRSLGKDLVELAVVGECGVQPIPSPRIELATAVPKGERFDWLVEKATEIGVSRLTPILSERSVVDPRAGKLDRLRRHVIEASKQCGRDRLMDLAPPESLPDLLKSRTSSARFLAHPGGEPFPMDWKADDVTFAIGPEGGFTEDEVTSAREAGWRIVGLGTTRLRIETAGLVASALVASQREGGGA